MMSFPLEFRAERYCPAHPLGTFLGCSPKRLTIGLRKIRAAVLGPKQRGLARWRGFFNK
jgi:hypothetical protein